jgi:hypothetical protein
MNMLFCAASPGLHSFFTNEAYPTSYFPFPVEVDVVPNFTTCQTDNKPETLKATHAHNQKTRLDIVTMMMPSQSFFRKIYPRQSVKRTSQNTKHGILHTFEWFIAKYGKTMTKDCKENQQHMAAD